ncbi:hypothetical protein RRG08_002687 [Elysia crispata]|uniref:Uncharacterized protein n=1 Tax=Elysia crispata TaxID=231223 RepID=A0AAE0XV51_9GAST|nr:hypothetical protein RRG08_002687 [Elysia crispata]
MYPTCKCPEVVSDKNRTMYPTCKCPEVVSDKNRTMYPTCKCPEVVSDKNRTMYPTCKCPEVVSDKNRTMYPTCIFKFFNTSNKQREIFTRQICRCTCTVSVLSSSWGDSRSPVFMARGQKVSCSLPYTIPSFTAVTMATTYFILSLRASKSLKT